MNASAADVERYRERLLALQKLGGEDLAVLRAGRTNAFARAAIGRGFRVVWILVAVGFFGGLFGAGAWFMAATLKPEHTVDVGGVPVAWPAIFLLFPVVFTLVAVSRAVALGRERRAPIGRLEGPLERGTAGGKYPQQYFMVAGEFFRARDSALVPELFQHVIPGAPVRVYVTAHRRLLVALEPLPVPGER